MRRVVLLAVCLGLVVPLPALGETCGEHVKTEVQKLGISGDNFNGMRFFTDRGALDRVRGYNVWVRFRSCEGHLVVVANRWCQVERHYWQGDCTDGAQPK